MSRRLIFGNIEKYKQGRRVFLRIGYTTVICPFIPLGNRRGFIVKPIKFNRVVRPVRRNSRFRPGRHILPACFCKTAVFYFVAVETNELFCLFGIFKIVLVERFKAYISFKGFSGCRNCKNVSFIDFKLVCHR